MSTQRETSPIVALAPMDGYTDQPMRLLVKTLEPRCTVYTEFMSAREFSHPAAWKRVPAISPQEQPLIVQFYGRHPREFADAAREAEQKGASGIDINMGCTARRVLGHGHGAAILQSPSLCFQIVETIKTSVSIPVSAKIRLLPGGREPLESLARGLEEHGLDLLTVHGRTPDQRLHGRADWEPIHRLKTQLHIPVIGNGDIEDASGAVAAIGELDGVMVGRAAVWRPQIMAEIATRLCGPTRSDPITPSVLHQAWTQFVARNFQIYPAEKAARRMRKYLIHLIRNVPHDLGDLDLARHASRLQEIHDLLHLVFSRTR